MGSDLHLGFELADQSAGRDRGHFTTSRLGVRDRLSGLMVPRADLFAERLKPSPPWL
jgi:hypothetical protein